MPRKNKIEDLRDHLFETLEALRDDDKPLDIDRAKAICQVAEKIIDTAKVEVSYAEAVGALPLTDFFNGDKIQPSLPAPRPNGREQ